MEINVIDALYLIDICDTCNIGYRGYYALCRPYPEMKIPEKFEALAKRIYKEEVDVRLKERGFTQDERAEIENFFHSSKTDLPHKISMFTRLDQNGREFYEEFLERVKLRLFD